MRNVLAALGGLIIGLLSTWLAAFLMSHAHIEHTFKRSVEGCSDGEHCQPDAIFIWMAVALVPVLACGVVACLASIRAWAARKAIVAIGAAVLVNMLFTCAGFML